MQEPQQRVSGCCGKGDALEACFHLSFSLAAGSQFPSAGDDEGGQNDAVLLLQVNESSAERENATT